MIVQISGVLTADQVRFMHERLLVSPWVDGLATAGYQGARVKDNRQIEEAVPLARELGDIILAALERNALFISAALPNRVYPPLFNRYEGGMQFGNHVDNAVRLLPGSGVKVRTDISATLFLSPPEEYDGGELLVEDTYGAHAIKLPAGDMVLYPATSLHRVTPITRGARLASFFWIESMVRDDAQRTLLFDLDSAIQRLSASGADASVCAHLTACYHNLLRMWAQC
ncbi:MAG: Fe2+-dependent dioxygenase [Burkholderiales bacterium]|jgi:PKHD-type hydroxylase|nr:Fe2+-dependent dioxygenase [Burkholderiales bacterium]